jgi:regulator of protease activity HflC (stomatin/prohibitin superfamily)
MHLANLPAEIGAPILGGILSGIIAFFKSFRFVREGERGIKLRFGKAVRKKGGTPKVIEPGFAWLIPFVLTR